jgi:hypothetical protein
VKLTGYHKIFEYSFGNLFCFENYVVGSLIGSSHVNSKMAKTILNDINDYYGNNKIVYISNRQFAIDIDPAIYKLVNPKKIVGIAIVGTGKEQRIQAASEQALYSGSFSFFNTIESAISWAQSFVGTKAAG